jgi:hypothetical protein
VVALGVGIVGRGRAVTGRAKRGESNDGSNAEVRSGRGRAVLSGEGSSTCESSSYWYVLISE